MAVVLWEGEGEEEAFWPQRTAGLVLLSALGGREPGPGVAGRHLPRPAGCVLLPLQPEQACQSCCQPEERHWGVQHSLGHEHGPEGWWLEEGTRHGWMDETSKVQHWETKESQLKSFP